MRILTVCTGNICRSPLAEHQLLQILDKDKFEVASAGIHAVPGGTVPEPQLQIGLQYGVGTLSGHRAHQVTKDIIEAADLVLVMTLEHRREVVRLVPAASKYTFTVREFAHLANAVSEEDLVELMGEGKTPEEAAVIAVAQLRGSVPGLRGTDDYDIIDPYRASASTYALSASQLIPPTRAAADYLDRAMSLSPQQ